MSTLGHACSGWQPRATIRGGARLLAKIRHRSCVEWAPAPWTDTNSCSTSTYWVAGHNGWHIALRLQGQQDFQPCRQSWNCLLRGAASPRQRGDWRTACWWKIPWLQTASGSRKRQATRCVGRTSADRWILGQDHCLHRWQSTQKAGPDCPRQRLQREDLRHVRAHSMLAASRWVQEECHVESHNSRFPWVKHLSYLPGRLPRWRSHQFSHAPAGLYPQQTGVLRVWDPSSLPWWGCSWTQRRPLEHRSLPESMNWFSKAKESFGSPTIPTRLDLVWWRSWRDIYGIKVFHTTLSRTLSPDGWKWSGKHDKMGEKEIRKLAHQHVVTTSYTCAWFLKQKDLKRPFVICSNPSILQELDTFGITKYVATIHADGKAKTWVPPRTQTAKM